MKGSIQVFFEISFFHLCFFVSFHIPVNHIFAIK